MGHVASVASFLPTQTDPRKDHSRDVIVPTASRASPTLGASSYALCDVSERGGHRVSWRHRIMDSTSDYSIDARMRVFHVCMFVCGVVPNVVERGGEVTFRRWREWPVGRQWTVTRCFCYRFLAPRAASMNSNINCIGTTVSVWRRQRPLAALVTPQWRTSFHSLISIICSLKNACKFTFEQKHEIRVWILIVIIIIITELNMRLIVSCSLKLNYNAK